MENHEVPKTVGTILKWKISDRQEDKVMNWPLSVELCNNNKNYTEKCCGGKQTDVLFSFLGLYAIGVWVYNQDKKENSFTREKNKIKIKIKENDKTHNQILCSKTFLFKLQEREINGFDVLKKRSNSFLDEMDNKIKDDRFKSLNEFLDSIDTIDKYKEYINYVVKTIEDRTEMIIKIYIQSKEKCEVVRIDMKRYIALLRGINISGKNKISMTELKSCFIELGCADVFTHLNSGNIIFSIDESIEIAFADKIKEMIQEQFGLDVPVFVILQEELKDLLSKAPAWWGTDNKENYDNLIFVMPPSTAESIAEQVGEPTKDLEKICICNNAIFWSFDRRKYAKANWWKKTANVGIGEMLTIRTVNTLRKIIGM